MKLTVLITWIIRHIFNKYENMVIYEWLVHFMPFYFFVFAYILMFTNKFAYIYIYIVQNRYRLYKHGNTKYNVHNNRILYRRNISYYVRNML